MKDYKVWPQVLVAIAGKKLYTLSKLIPSHIESSTANGGSLLYGISLGWSSPSGPIILATNHEFVMTTEEFSWAVSLMPLGGALSSLFSGTIRNHLGTKMTILMFSLPNFLGWMSIAFASNSAMVGLKD